MSVNPDPMMMAGIDTHSIAMQMGEKKIKPPKPPSELDLKKEERLHQKEQRLAQKMQSASSSSKDSGVPEAPPLPPIDPSQLLDKIAAYRERFPKLKSRNPKLSAKNSVEELLDELHYIELQLGSGSDGSFGNMLFLSGMSLLETSTHYFNPLKLQLHGLAKVSQDNIEQFSPIIDELMIKYGAGLYMPPEYRLVIATGMLVFTVHSANTGDARVGEMLSKMNKVVNAPPGSENM